MAEDHDTGPEMAREVMRYFFVPATEGPLTPQLTAAVREASPLFEDAVQAFVYNVEAAISTVAMPSQLAMAGAHRWRLQQFHMAERIRARSDLGPDGQPTEAALQAARERAHAKMAAELSKKDGIDHLADSASDFLLAALKSKDVSRAATELLLQGVVLIWGAFEVLAREIVVRHLNARPSDAVRVLSLPEVRRLFQFKSIDIETLAEYSFDLSRKMGTVLASAHDLASLPALKTVLLALFPVEQELRRALDANELWLLSQRRHLIVHQRGLVDRKYLEHANDGQQLGARLAVSPDELMGYILLVQNTGASVIAAAGRQHERTGSSEAQRPTDRCSGPAAPAAER